MRTAQPCWWVALATVAGSVGCGPSGSLGTGGTSSGASGFTSSTANVSSGSNTSGTSSGSSGSASSTGNPNGHCAVPTAAMAVDVSHPTTVVGSGTAASCTADKVVAAVHAGGVVTFDCGPDPLAIAVPEIDIYNDGGQGDGSVTIDGGGKITLGGSGANRILYQNTCDQNLHWTTSQCQAQSAPHLVVQNIAFAGGNGSVSSSVLGGGAIYVGGGTFKAINTRFAGNSEPTLGQDYAGGAIYTTNQTQPVYIVNSTLQGNSGSNGGALGSIGTSWTILNSAFAANAANGVGQNPARPNTPGGGLGGAIYNDGNNYTLTICGNDFASNIAVELGTGTIFMVSNNLTGVLAIDQSTFEGNTNNGSVQSAHPSIYVEAQDKVGTAGVTITNTTFK